MGDRRLTPATARVAHKSLRGTLDRPAYTDGAQATVAVPVTDLCAAPDGARDRQLLFGAPVLVIDEAAGWRFVLAQDDGYCGWLAPGTLSDKTPGWGGLGWGTLGGGAGDGAGDGVGPATHRVCVPATHVYLRANIKTGEAMSLPLGARVRVAAHEGSFARLAGGGFVPLVHLSDRPATDPVEVAQLLLGAPYLWGGNSRGGIDCSGLVQAALWACGRPCPGDSDLQLAAFPDEVDPDRIARGDLLFWRGHVAMAIDATRMIHANGHTMSVACEGITEARARIEAAGEGPFLGVRRP